MLVKQINTDTHEVSEFVRAMPHLTYTVTFIQNIARVTARSGCTTTEWDRYAIQAVQVYLITGKD